MDDFLTKLLLAVIAFLLGLLADALKRFWGRERRRVTYSVERHPIIEIGGHLPAEVLSKSVQANLNNVTRFTVLLKSTGSDVVTDAACTLAFGEGSRVLLHQETTNPKELVKYAAAFNDTAGSARVTGLTLEPQQSVTFEVFVESPAKPSFSLHGAGGAGKIVEWQGSASEATTSLTETAVTLFKLYIGAVFAPSIISALFLLFSGIAMAGSDLRGEIQMAGIGLGNVIGSLISLYFYIRMIPHLQVLLSEFKEWRQSRPANRSWSDT